MRPLIRWTVGTVKGFGWEVFSESVRLLPKVYPEFDFVICYNHVSIEEEQRLKDSGIPLFHQKRSDVDFPVCWEEGKSVLGKSDVFAWKLAPPRLRPEAHELWVDNDVVVCGRIPEVDEWLNSNTGLISRGRHPNYGRFASQIPIFKSCAGFFGLPPNFDFAEKIRQRCEGHALEGYDEQGLVTLVVSEMEGFIKVPIDTLTPFPPGQTLVGRPLGMHFHHANHSTWHRPWRAYKLFTIP